MKRTAKYYASHPEARAKKKAYDSEFQKKPSQVRKRVELNKYNRDHNDPKGNGTDASHKGGKIVGYESQSKNRGRKEKSRLKNSKRNGRG